MVKIIQSDHINYESLKNPLRGKLLEVLKEFYPEYSYYWETPKILRWFLTTKTGNKMTEALKIGMEAINKWIFHGWNYEITEVDMPDYVNGGSNPIHVPRFIKEAKWTCNLPHMINKWMSATCRSHNTDAYLVTFYANLDNENRQILLEWVLENYSDEQKLF